MEVAIEIAAKQVEIPFHQIEVNDGQNIFLRILKHDDECSVLYRGQLFSTYDCQDMFARNHIIVQLRLSHKIKRDILAEAFGIKLTQLGNILRKYNQSGSRGLLDKMHVRVRNGQKIKGKVAEYITELREQKNPPTYNEIKKLIKKRFRKEVGESTISNWWQAQQKEAKSLSEAEESVQLALVKSGTELETSSQAAGCISKAKEVIEKDQESEIENSGYWQANAVAGSFLLYGVLQKSLFLSPFVEGIKGDKFEDRSSVERVMLTLFFLHALRLKSIEQTKSLSSQHFSPLVQGPFHRVQNLRYAIDAITAHKNFDKVVMDHFRNLGFQTDLGDEIYYTDGHFSSYYGKYLIPWGYDPRRQRGQRGRNTIYLHNSLGHVICLFESPTNTTLSVDIMELLEKMKGIYGSVKGKTLFFDRGGFSAECFKRIKQEGMYFSTYLKHRNKEKEISLDLFEEQEFCLNGKIIKRSIYEKERESRRYGRVRIIIFIGKEGRQIPILSTNPNLEAVEIVVRQQKRWVEENGFKYSNDHFNIDLLTTYKTEEAPDKVMERANPERKEINGIISRKKSELKIIKAQLVDKLKEVSKKDELTIQDFEEQEQKLNFEIKNLEMEIGMLELERPTIPSKVVSNLKDECVLTKKKRRLFINLIKSMNYNCEKWLQDYFIKYHPKKDETLSLIRNVFKQPGRVRDRGSEVEVELDRLDSGVQAASLDRVIEKLNEYDYFRFPDGRRLRIWQAE